ncbi:OLC1v1036635C1 [Oldenlandia corymbosa var. corymbosa]|uniref:Receptor-like serine/threonine-protein kinase n=1 Tax=Oldenlandia corymbosa var. corymbosa TaxID=529605 RepID=A0AAV1CX46_OLDCO|nr:OLC1v1036635C1 [Oldenlandia corymbosa var. corymbosa]
MDKLVVLVRSLFNHEMKEHFILFNQPISSNFLYVLFLLLALFHNSLASLDPHYLAKGETLFVENHDTKFITSPDDTFTFGFYKTGNNAFSLAIWFTKPKTLVWMANREKPVNGVGSKVSLGSNGAMVLTDFDGTVSWDTNTTSTDIARAELLNSGNLVLKNSRGDVKWQSFDYPTDTLLPNQNFTRNSRLVSSSRNGSYDPRYFSLKFDSDNVLRLIYDGPEISSIYWPNPEDTVRDNGRTSYNSTRNAVLDDRGWFLSSDGLNFKTIDMGFGINRRMTLDYDGNLRVYSLNNSTGSWQVSWQALTNPCLIRGLCGENGICVFSSQPKCSCPPGYVVNDPSDWSRGCKPTFDLSGQNNQPMKLVKIPEIDYFGYFDINHTASISLDVCQKICLENSNCKAVIFRDVGCYPKSALFNGLPAGYATLFLKVPQNLSVSEPVKLEGHPATCEFNPRVVEGNSTLHLRGTRRVIWIYLYSFCFALLGIELVFVLLGWFFLFRKSNVSDTIEHGYEMIASQFRRFSYEELRKATNNFSEELGKGGSGVVYKGVLSDGRMVGVKRLGDVLQGDEEFWSEMNIIGKINHMNLVRTWGYCSGKKHRLLVYEYVENSSLDKHLFSKKRFLGWEQRFAVAFGTAKALAYLHDECLEWVIHCDIKPENILLDGDLQPKIADFGLAKLYQRGGGGSGLELSRIRGTKGYMAPEWALNQPITAKVDVYSYGIVILEIVSGIRLSNWTMNRRTNQLETELAKLTRIIKGQGEESWIERVLDPRLKRKVSKKQAITLIKVGYSCAQEDRNKRPRMASVVETLLQAASGNSVRECSGL